MPSPTGFTTVTKFFLPQRFASRAIATCIWKKKNRAACSNRSTCRFTAAEKVPPCAWKSKRARIRKSSSGLQANFRLSPLQVYRVDGPMNLSRVLNLYELTPRPDLKYRAFAPRELPLKPGASSVFELVRKRNILLHHPYDSYSTVVRFIESAAQDPDVLSIKQTLYRTSENSPIVRALIDAAARKEVAVVVELKARFDEASNIRWARNLQEAGVQVFHGVVGLKTHCKLALVARRETDGQIRRYAHLGTGNYNPSTARFYTDLSLLTSDTRITSSVHHVFNYLTAHSERSQYSPLFVAPLNLGRNFLGLIERETAHAKAGRPAFIFAKFNSLLDEQIIESLYRASQAGVQIDLIVRGACALRPGVRGLSSRIRVRSVIGRFLEHSRIFVFGNGGKTELFLGSADWMQRNIYERVEVIFRIKDPVLLHQIFTQVIEPYLADNLKTRILQPDGELSAPARSPQARPSPQRPPLQRPGISDRSDRRPPDARRDSASSDLREIPAVTSRIVLGFEPSF